MVFDTSRSVRKSEVLLALLKDIRGSLDDEQAEKVDSVLQQFENDTPPPTPSFPIGSSEKRARPSSDDIEHGSQAPGEDQVAASVGSNEDLDFLEEDQLGDENPNHTGYLGRNSQVQWMRTLQRTLDQPFGESSDLPYAIPGDSESAFAKRSEAMHRRQEDTGDAGPLSEYYFYLDNQSLNEINEPDPNTVPPIETAKALFGNYRAAVHDPFRILDAQFEVQLHEFYQLVENGRLMAVDSRWKAVFNLVLAIGARYSHLTGADWQADSYDHMVYMSRAVGFLGLNNITALVCAPNRLLIQVCLSCIMYSIKSNS